MQKIIADMRESLSFWKEHGFSANEVSVDIAEWIVGIEALMKGPVAWMEPITGRLVSDLQKRISSMSYDTYTIPLFATPPDAQALIDAALNECIDIFINQELKRTKTKVLHYKVEEGIREIRSRIGKPLEK